MGFNRNWIALIAVGLGIALFITLFSPFASGDPDGLERVAEDKEFLEHAEDPSYEIIPDYVVPGVENERVATILAGVIGVLIVAGVMLGLGALLRSRDQDAGTDSAPRQSPTGLGD
jgi:hypothetical protein